MFFWRPTQTRSLAQTMIETHLNRGSATCMIATSTKRTQDFLHLSQTSQAEYYPAAALGAKCTGGADDKNRLREKKAEMIGSQLEFLSTEAEQLLAEQESLRQRLDQVLQSSGPQTGLYRGESVDAFPLFVQHLRKVLTQSPRTILRQALDSASPENLHKESMRELRSLLQVEVDASFHTMGQTIDALSKGNLHHRWAATKERLAKCQYFDEEELRKIISEGMSRKRGCHALPSAIQETVIEAHAKQIERRNSLQEQMLHLEKEMQGDREHQRYCRAVRLWKDCGGDRIWHNYKHVETAICRNRNIRGDRFESNACDLVFLMIVQQLCETSQPIDDYWYDRGAYWWQAGRNVGEVDIVVHHKRRGVTAVCEMKSSSFEIAAASRQHDAKLVSAEKSQVANEWAIGRTREGAVNVSGQQRIPLFVATLLPNIAESSCLLGVEPLVARAVCQGIRSQGRRIVHDSTLELCSPLATMLVDNDMVTVDDAIDYLENLPACSRSPHEDDDIDYNQLQSFVLEAVGAEHLVESPKDWFARFPQERLLVLPRTFVSAWSTTM